MDALRDAGTIETTHFLNVGYGSSEQVVDPRFIHLNQNRAQGYSGTGYGDSGGPTFVQTASGPVVVSVVSTGDVALYATSVNTRVDTAEVRAFLAPYLALN